MSDMGKPAAIRQPEPGRPVVAFDFDGTLTIRDSFTAFLRWRSGPFGWAVGMARLAPAALAWLGDRDRGRIKAASVNVFLRDLTRAELEAEAERFTDRMWSRFLRPDAVACWNAWGERGAYRVIVTASPETTVAPFARRLGADALIGTQLAFDAHERVTGAFACQNCRSDEKVRRLHAAYGPDLRLTAAYGDTSGDTAMLAIAEEAGFRVFTERP